MAESVQSRNPSADRFLNVTVRRVIPAGLIVGLPDGREGLIRERELAWDPEARRGWRERYKPGDSVKAVALKVEDGQRPELSLRLAQDDPWLDIEDRYPLGALVDGEVTGIMPYGIFVELEPGVTGLAHSSRFPSWVKSAPGDAFWPGDLVKVIISEIDPLQRKITLNLADPARLRWTQAAQANPSRATPRRKNEALPGTSQVIRTSNLLQHAAKSVLVADDSAAARSEIGDWLRNAGHHVVLAADGPSALAAVRSAPPEVALVDVRIPGISGAQVAQEIRREWPEIRCILMSGNYDLSTEESELTALEHDGISLLYKPFRPEELLQHLFDNPAVAQQSVAARPTPQAKALQRLPLQHRSQLARVVEHLWRATRVDLVVLFELDPAHRTLRVIEQCGRTVLPSAALPVLIHSPVRDVAEDGLIVRAADADEAGRPRFRHLAAHLRFASCLGLPISVTLPNRYALFLLSDQPHLAVNLSVETFASASAIAAAAWLERDAFEHQAAELQRLVLLGQLGRTLVHEINNQAQNLPWAAKKLPECVTQVNRLAEADLPRAQEALAEANQLLQEVSIEVKRLAGIAKPFTGLARLDHQDSLLLNMIVEEAVSVVQDTAQRANVTLTIETMFPVAYLRGQDTALLQALVNLLLNAVQQIELTRGRGGGRVAIRLTASQSHDRQAYWISIEDDGPGIHRRLWERIFEMGYSTRPGGSGIGLSVARNLVERMAGRIFVAESWLGWGSTFAVELPR